jgi:hypothetical protein
MMSPTKEQVLALLRTGSPADRVAFVTQLPANGFTEAAAALLGSGNASMAVIALSPVIQEYCNGSNPELGAVLAAATHERAVEVFRTVPDHGLLPTTLSGLACSHLKALTLLGRSKEVLEEAEGYRRSECCGSKH